MNANYNLEIHAVRDFPQGIPNSGMHKCLSKQMPQKKSKRKLYLSNMKMIVDIPEVKSNFFQELLHSFDYVRVIKTIEDRQKEKQVADLADAFNDVKLHEQGKKKLKTAKEFFDEL